MRAAIDLDDYRRCPDGSILVGDQFLGFCAHAALWGFSLWGQPDEAQARNLISLLELELGAAAKPHASLVDTRRLEAVKPLLFAAIGKYVDHHFTALARQVTRLALIHGSGLAGSTVAGFFQVVRPPYPVALFEDGLEAAAWAGGDATLIAELDDAIAGSSARHLVEALRRWLEVHLVEASLANAARWLARSPRSLQRDLHEVGTTFRHELEQARVRTAQRLLRASDTSITAVALEVGCATPQHFSTLFHRLVGMPPRAWRARTPGPKS